ncbi:MAG: hypothetical protein IIA62_11625 [Nitrospinae bacterium]|nr:hypothetical protein [Nitrospinota bacterium]
METALFNSIPSEDRMQLFSNGEPEGKKIADFLNYKKQDVSAATGIPLASIRYDIKKMPAELRERLVEWATALNLVAEYFNDFQKTILWFQVSNPLLGNMTPRDMIRLGRFKKLFKFIQTALDENRRKMT